MGACCALLVTCAAGAVAGEWKSHQVRQLQGTAPETLIPAKLQIVTEDWNRVVAVPYLVFMPERQRLLMLVACDYPHRAMVTHSDDRGTTWTTPRYLHVDAAGQPDLGMCVGLTYLGGGTLSANEGPKRWWSRDYGETWTAADNPPASNGRTWTEWDPLLVSRNRDNPEVAQLMSFCSDNLQPDGHFQGYIRFSSDRGATWVDELKVPQMQRVNEVAFVRAANGDIVAACRTDNPDEYRDQIDHYGGLGVSISKDNGRTWSALNMLYPWGRHHPSMVRLPTGDVVMTYVVRKGYPDSEDGFPRFGIEAVVSRDHGQSWDLDRRYVLDAWVGNRKGPNAWWASCQATSTVLLPDGFLLTAFGTGFRSQPGPPGQEGLPRPRDVGLVLWRAGEYPGGQSIVH
jgi:hypothetical protein